MTRLRSFFATTRAALTRSPPGETRETGMADRVFAPDEVDPTARVAKGARLGEGVQVGHGFGIADARPSIELVHRIRTAAISGEGATHAGLEA